MAHAQFDCIYERYAPEVLRYAIRCTGRREIAEEIASEAFLRLHREWNRIDPATTAAWLMSVVKRLAVDYWRHLRVERLHSERWAAAANVSSNISGADSFLLHYESLKPEHRVCLELRYAGGMTRSEIAAHTGLTDNQVKSCLQYGLRLLRAALNTTVAACVAVALVVPLAREEEKLITSLRSVHATNRAVAAECVRPVAKAPLRLPLATAMVMRGAKGADEQRYLRELGHALEPYRADDFQEASARLERLASRYPRRVEPVFYLGVARLIAGHAEAAARALESAKRIGSGELDDDITAYLSKARQAAACNVARQ
jgi:RNA polymerase sigma-70 factor, ECF subfamily